jgi:uncharacterized coiled-coil DUF342 family protein
MKFFGCVFPKRKGRDGRDKEWEVLFAALTTIIDKEKSIMAEIKDLKEDADLAVAKIDNLNTALDGVRADMDIIKSELEELKANGGLNAEQKAMVDQAHATLITAVQKIDETLAENVPASPPPPDGDVV